MTLNKLQVFKNSEFGELSILIIDGKEYFPAADCARVLGYANPHKAISDHCRGVTKREVIDNLGRTQEKNFIPEGDLYRLIVRSNLPAAERFERWVFDDVLPAIRRTGSYSIQIPQTYPEALRLAADLAEENQRLLPKAEMHDLFLSADNCQSMNVVAKSLGTGRTRLFQFLRDKEILTTNNTPYQEYLHRGYFRVVEKPIVMGDQAINKPQTFVTAKGVDFIAKLKREDVPCEKSSNLR